jgi:dTDP-4-amino-4,6-dideoxygalactose transaminase
MKNNRDDFLVFGQPLIEQDEIDEVVDSLKKAWLGTGPKVREFERIFSEYKNMPYAAAVNSCTAALHLSLLSLGLKPGDEVITTSMTFCATVNAIIHTGATPVLVDIDPATLNIETDAIEKKITDKTKAVLIVHFAGRCCRMDSILEITKRNKLFLVEDCAHAIESEYDGQKAGTFGDLGCFSFYSTKNIVTGEGGIVLSKNKELIDKIKILALHGMSADAWERFSDAGYKHYYVEDAGYKYNMMDIQAAIGIHQMKRVDSYWKRRQKIWQCYMKEFSDLPIGLPASIENEHRHAYHLFTIRIDENLVGLNRDAFFIAMKEENIGTGVHYLAIPEHPYYKRTFGWKPEEFPNATEYGRQTVSLPISAKLSDKDVCDVIEAVRKIINKG